MENIRGKAPAHWRPRQLVQLAPNVDGEVLPVGWLDSDSVKSVLQIERYPPLAFLGEVTKSLE
eukprot:scaffold290323_cov41-Prasinocladus_malaysianus.AAC.4